MAVRRCRSHTREVLGPFPVSELLILLVTSLTIFSEHTSFAALPDHEVHCSPRENEEWHRLQTKKQAMADAARREVLLQPSLPMHEVANIGGYNRDAQNFIRTGEVKKHRPQENKAGTYFRRRAVGYACEPVQGVQVLAA